MKLHFITLDVFTSTRYAGNPLAIVLVPAEYHSTLTQSQKQSIATEFNLSETVFMHEIYDGPVIAVDIFTSIAEIPFAGHPTIGSAWYLLQHRQQQRVQALQTKAGRIPIALLSSSSAASSLASYPSPSNGSGSGGLVRAAIPHSIHIHARTFASSLNGGRANPIVSIVRGMSFILTRLADLAALARAKSTLYEDAYDPEILDRGWQEGLIGTLFYAPVPVGSHEGGNGGGGGGGGGGVVVQRAFRTRMHASREDPATGSASSALGAYLALNEPVELGAGPFRYLLTQGVEMGKKSDIVVDVTRAGPGSIAEIFLSGTAVKVMEGSLEI